MDSTDDWNDVMAKRLRHGWALVGVAALMWTTGCAASSQPRTDEATAAVGSTASEDGGQPASQPFSALPSDLDNAISRAQTTLRAECMTEAGFPQMQESWDQDQPFATLGYDMRQFGPTTVDEARRFGMSQAWREQYAPTTNVYSNDPAFETAAEECRRQVHDAFGDTSDLQRSYVDFENRLNSTFLAVLERDGDHLEAYETLLSCLTDRGWPPRDPADVLSDEGWSAMDIETGNLERDPPSVPDQPNTTVVIDVAPPDYEPTAEEIRLAEDVVECRRSTDFDQQIAAAYNGAQRQALAGQEPQLEEFRSQLEDALHQIETAGGTS